MCLLLFINYQSPSICGVFFHQEMDELTLSHIFQSIEKKKLHLLKYIAKSWLFVIEVKKIPQSTTSNLYRYNKKILKSPQSNNGSNIALMITPSGKLFQIILNISHLSLVRLGIGLSICISPLIVHYSEGSEFPLYCR